MLSGVKFSALTGGALPSPGGIVPESLLIGSIGAGRQCTVGEIAGRSHATIARKATLCDVMSKMRSDRVPVILVVHDAKTTAACGVNPFIAEQEVSRNFGNSVSIRKPHIPIVRAKSSWDEITITHQVVPSCTWNSRQDAVFTQLRTQLSPGVRCCPAR